MEIKKKKISGQGFRFSLLEEEEEVGRARLYVLNNDLHQEPFGFIEDVFIKEGKQGKGYGTAIVKSLVETAKEKGCYKVICTSRFSREQVHSFYEKLNLAKYGYEFRINL
jgi:GNAT superfamily N-acetyltransferase